MSFECPICLEKPKEATTLVESGHTYCKLCINEWLKRNNTCPETRLQLKIPIITFRNYAVDELLNKPEITKPEIIKPDIIRIGKSSSGTVLRTLEYIGPLEKKNISILIDISGSTDIIPDNEAAKESRMNLLELILHTVKAYILCLPEYCSFSIYTYSTNVSKIFMRSEVNKESRKRAITLLSSLSPGGTTNTWQAIRRCLDDLNDEPFLGESQILHFTDGIPDTGDFDKLLTRWLNEKNREDFPACITNIGFGNNLKLDSLLELSEKTGGKFKYIPSFNECCSVFLSDFTETIETSVDDLVVVYSDGEVKNLGKINCVLNKDFLLKSPNYELYLGTTQIVNFEEISETAEIVEQFRLRIIDAIQSAPNVLKLNQIKEELNTDIPELLEFHKDVSGQISIAFEHNYFHKIPENTKSGWGKFYLKFLQGCYERQSPGNDKDFGMKIKKNQRYDDIYYDALDLYSKIEFTKCSNRTMTYQQQQLSQTAIVSAADGNSNGCFSGTCNITMIDGSEKLVSELKKGDLLFDGFEVEYVVISYGKFKMYKLNDLLITGTHPILINDVWIHPQDTFPFNYRSEESIPKPFNPYSKSCPFTADFDGETFIDHLLENLIVEETKVYNLILKKKGDKRGSYAVVGGIKCVTLAHDLNHIEILNHDFFGTEAVVENLININSDTESGILYCNGHIRDITTGWIVGLY